VRFGYDRRRTEGKGDLEEKGGLHDGVSCDAFIIGHDEGVDALFSVGVEMGWALSWVVRTGSGWGGCFVCVRVVGSGRVGSWIKWSNGQGSVRQLVY